VKFVLFVEGHTEKAVPDFLKRWLDPQLRAPVRIQPVRFEGWPEFTRKTARKAQMYLDFPAHVRASGERYRWGVKHFQDQVGRPDFRMFFAVHEIEAWILSQPESLPKGVREALPGKALHPESVNFSEPPAKLMDRLYRQYTGDIYKKVVDGSRLLKKLDPVEACAKCPHLADMLNEMLRLARSRGL
jgi:Domain of unknown function (DUF4276)